MFKKSFAIILLAALSACASDATLTPPPAPSNQTWFIFLETGKKAPADRALVTAMQKAHLDNFRRLFGEGKLQAAGPLRDPAGLKRGIVVVTAPTRDVMASYFTPDTYVTEGYMTLNAAPAVIGRALNDKDIDPTGIEEVRIVLVSRPASRDSARDQRVAAWMKQQVESGKLGAWYQLKDGAIADVAFVRTTDTTALDALFATHPAVAEKAATASVWQQWIGKGVLK